jgi:hypothetical protein
MAVVAYHPQHRHQGADRQGVGRAGWRLELGELVKFLETQ